MAGYYSRRQHVYVKKSFTVFVQRAKIKSRRNLDSANIPITIPIDLKNHGESYRNSKNVSANLEDKIGKSFSSLSAVWQDFAKFATWVKLWKSFREFLRVFQFLAKCWTYFCNFSILLCKISLLQMAKYWTIILPSGHTVPRISR